MWSKEEIKSKENELKQLRAFVFEWSERFGFLAEINPRDSIESIDEVAEMLARRIRELQKEKQDALGQRQ